MHIINTSAGAKTPAQALEIFKQAMLPDGALFGILKQLLGLLVEGPAACQYVLDNEKLYTEKIVRMCREKQTGRPIGPKVVNDSDDIRRFLNGCGVVSTVAITIREDQPRSVLRFLNNVFVEVVVEYKVGLTAVGISGRWEYVPRTFLATVTLLQPTDVLPLWELMSGVVEKLELMNLIQERVPVHRTPHPLGQTVRDILRGHPDLFYDRELFLKVCGEWEFASPFVRVEELNDRSTMEDALMLFHGNCSREEFLEYYIEAFNAALS